MTADRYAELREALAAGPTPGPWKEAGRVAAHGEAIRIRSVNIIERGYEIADVIDANGYPSNTANAALIAACDPGTIAALLAERDALRAIVEMADAVIEGAVTEFVRVPYGASHEDVAQINDWHRMAAETRSAMAALAAQERP